MSAVKEPSQSLLTSNDSAANEVAGRFGVSKHMVGVVHRGHDSSLPAVVFLNAGLIHRIGPRRVHVQLARQLGQMGYTSLRLDLSGIGESDARPDSLDIVEALMADVKEALDDLTVQCGAQRFVLFGICSGARVAYHFMRRDPRVVGAVLIEAGEFGTTQEGSPAAGNADYVQHYVRHYWRNVRGRGMSFKRVVGWFTGKANYRYALKIMGAQAKGLFRSKSMLKTARHELLQELSRLAQRPAKVLIANTEKGASLDFFQMTLENELPKIDGISAHMIANTDHDFPTLASQNALQQMLLAWLQGSFGVEPASTMPPKLGAASETKVASSDQENSD